MKTSIVLVLILVSGAVTAADDKGEVVFAEEFGEELDAGWTWLRMTPDDWRIVDGALELRARPGLADTVKNALLRPVPEAAKHALAFEITLTFTTPLTEQYEQAGLVWYADNKPVFKLVHELIDNEYFIIPGRIPMDKKTVRLRLLVANGKYSAQFRPEGEEEYRTASEGDLALGRENHISIQCYHGPEDADHWMRFSDFKILKMD